MEFNTVIITKRGSGRQDGFKTPFSVHKFSASTEQEVQAIINHPSIKGWKYGISIGYANLK
jgi:hypothetical protein